MVPHPLPQRPPAPTPPGRGSLHVGGHAVPLDPLAPVRTMSDDRPSRYVEDGRVVYRASAFGSCVKVLTALGLGMTPEPFPGWLLERFRQGVAGEPVVLGQLRRTWRLMGERDAWWLSWDDGQPLVEVRVGRRVLIRGHADAIGQRFIDGDGERRLIEVKCTTPDYAVDILRHLPELYCWQISVYAQAMRLPAVLALGIKNEAGEVERVVETPVPTIGMPAIKHRAYEIESYIADGWLPPCSYRQWPCPFPELCDDPGDPGPDHQPTQDWELEDRLAQSLAERRQRSG